VRAYQRRAYNLAFRLLGDGEEAADVVQDALVRAYTRLGEFRGDAAFSTWLYRIVHNMCLDALRWRARHPRAPLPAAGGPESRPASAPADPGDGPEAAALRREQRDALVRALAELSPEFRAAVVLRDVQGLDYAEVAAITGVSLGTVKSRLHRARARLRELLAAAEPERGAARQAE
jgi:RNA polymerase sigma-70 factor (ECF subfamily)